MDRQLVVSVAASVAFLVTQLSSSHNQVIKGFVHYHIKTPSPHPIEASPTCMEGQDKISFCIASTPLLLPYH